MKDHVFAAICAVSLGVPFAAHATPYDALATAGGPFGITPNPATFLTNVTSGFADGIGFADIDVTGLSGDGFAFVDLNFNRTLSAGEFFEADGSFDITVAGSAFEITGISLSLTGSGSAGNGSSFGFVEAFTEVGGTTDLFTEIVRDASGANSDVLSDTRSLAAPVTSFTFNWAIQAENDDVDSVFLGFARFEVALNDTSVAAVPLPAGLPLLLAGLAGLGLIRRRR